MAENSIQIRLIPQSEAALDNLAEITEISNRNDLVNRAIQVYNFVMSAQDEGKEIYLHDPNVNQLVVHRSGAQSTSNEDEIWQLLEIE